MLAAESRRAQRLVRDYNASDPSDAAARRRILEELLGSIGEGTEIRPPLYCDYGFRMHVGARVFVNFGLVALESLLAGTAVIVDLDGALR